MTKIAGPATYKISKSNSDSTAVIELVEGEYKLELTVTDNNGAVGKDTILVTVNAAAITHVANAGFGSSITLPVITTSMSGTGSDADGKIAGYAWSPASGQQLFSGRTRSATTTLNNLLQGNYTFRLQGSFQYLPL